MTEQENLEKSPDFLKTILESSPNFISVINKDGIFKYLNRVVGGLEKSKVLGSSIYTFIPEQDVEALKSHVKRALDENKTVYYETRGAGPNNTVTVYSCSVSPVIWEGERVIVSIGTDISALKAIEKELHEKIDELEFMNKSMINREVKMAEMKSELEKLKASIAK